LNKKTKNYIFNRYRIKTINIVSNFSNKKYSHDTKPWIDSKSSKKKIKTKVKISGLSNTSYQIYQIVKIKKIIIIKTSNNIFLEHFGFLTYHVDLSCNEFTGHLSKENVKSLKAVEIND
jgi:hypothetical protein